MIDGLHFLRPYWLLLLPLALLLCWLVLKRRDHSNPWLRQGDAALLEAQMVGSGERGGWMPVGLLGLAWFIGIVALAGPAWQQAQLPVYSDLQSRIMVFDLSRSMDSGDLEPSRLTRARYRMTDLVSGGGARQQGLVVFAGDAFVVSPMTDDRDTLINMIPALETGTVPIQGSRADRGLAEAEKMIERSGFEQVEIVLLSDGVNAASEAAARRLSAQGHTVHVIGVGTRDGAPIELAGGGLLKNTAGDIVIPAVDYPALQRVATAGNGRFFQLAPNAGGIEWLNREQSLLPAESNIAEVEQVAGSAGTLRWLDGGIWLLVPLLLIAVTGFRRGLLLSALLVVSVAPRPVIAFDWTDLWQRADQQAAQALANDMPEQIPERAAPDWKGAGAYRSEQWQNAAEQFAMGQDSEADYNRGNALAHAGKLPEALAAWEQTLARNPDHVDARFNHDLVTRLLENQPQQQAGEGGERDGESSGDGQEGDEGEPDDQSAERSEQDRAGDENTADPTADDGESESGDQQNALGSNAADDPGEQDNADDPTQLQTADEEQGESDASESDSIAESIADNEVSREQQQALEQWLKQVPDDPGGLLRRKFQYQFSRREQTGKEVQQW